MKVYIVLIIGSWLTVSGWIVTVRARRRMRKALGRKPADLEIVSLKTWMQVEQEEELNQAIHPT